MNAPYDTRSISSDRNKRLVILTDMENEPDDSQTMVKLLMYSNEIDIEGLIAVSSVCLSGDVFPESIRDRVIADGCVRDNLLKHADGWPETDSLLAKVAGGQKELGMAGVGDGRETDGSNLIIHVLEKDDDRPVYFAINAGANTLAQALWTLRRTRSAADLAALISKVRVYDDMGQDDGGSWIAHNFPQIPYVRSRRQVTALFGPDGEGPQPWYPLNQYTWAEKHIRTRHGILGALYPQRVFSKKIVPCEGFPFLWNDEHKFRFMDGGGTSSWIGLVNKGLYDPDRITWGGWGGRFSDAAEQVPAWFADRDGTAELEELNSPYLMFPQTTDTWYDEVEHRHYAKSIFAPVWRWRRAYTADFQARMDWCVAEWSQANHHPVAAVFGDSSRTILELRAKPGDAVRIDASTSTDPDGDSLQFHWFHYPEPGNYPGTVRIDDDRGPVSTLHIPDDASDTDIHVILEVSDDNPIASLTSYRRIVVVVR